SDLGDHEEAVGEERPEVVPVEEGGKVVECRSLWQEFQTPEDLNLVLERRGDHPPEREQREDLSGDEGEVDQRPARPALHLVPGPSRTRRMAIPARTRTAASSRTTIAIARPSCVNKKAVL